MHACKGVFFFFSVSVSCEMKCNNEEYVKNSCLFPKKKVNDSVRIMIKQPWS